MKLNNLLLDVLTILSANLLKISNNFKSSINKFNIPFINNYQYVSGAIVCLALSQYLHWGRLIAAAPSATIQFNWVRDYLHVQYLVFM